MKSPTIALAVQFKEGVPLLLDTISDPREITIIESSADQGENDPLKRVYDHRQRQVREDDEFSDYVENLLSRPFLKVDVQQHGVQWLKSRIRIEQFQKVESDAANVIAHYAFDIFSGEPTLRDFFLAGPKAQVRIRVFIVSDSEPASKSA